MIGYEFESNRFIVISSSRMHLKGANIAANTFKGGGTGGAGGAIAPPTFANLVQIYSQ